MSLSPEELDRIAAEQRATNAAAIKKSALEQPIVVDTSRKPPAIKLDAAALLDQVRSFIGRFCVYPDEHALAAVALWAAHTHMIEHFHTTPRLLVSSPEAGSGKTRTLELLQLLVPEPMLALDVSPSTVFRTLKQRQITLLLDEVDAIWSRRGKDDEHNDLRGLLNAGYKRGVSIPRCVGRKHEVVYFPVYAACALAGIGDLPDTIMTRAIIIRMRRRAPNEPVEPFRTREQEDPGHKLAAGLAAWARRVGKSVGHAWPALPDGIVDRPAEIWEPLIAVADAAGGHWPATARAACVSLCRSALDRRLSLGVRLLGDLKIIFGEAIALHTRTILDRLHQAEASGLAADAPWADLHGKALGERMLASILRPYGVKSIKVKVGGVSAHGYRREHLWDAWQRYLPHTSGSEQAEPAEPAEPAAPLQPVSNGDGSIGSPGSPNSVGGVRSDTGTDEASL